MTQRAQKAGDTPEGRGRRETIGRYPTPVERLAELSCPDAELWVKRDDLTHEVYGGNKVRKLEHILPAARARGTKRLVTIGAAGSHHVLATTYFGRAAGFDVEAVLVPQLRTDRVVEVLRADLALGLRAFAVRSWAAAPLALAARALSGATVVALGGSSVAGSMGYVDAARELAEQVRGGAMPEPDVCVVALGSGGTAAGLAAGFEAEGLKTRVVGVCVSQPPWLLRLASLVLARACARLTARSASLPSLRWRLIMDYRFLGRGYGYPTAYGDEATRVAQGAAGLALDPTYTAKAFASALWHVRARRGRCILYWHTLSSAPMEPLVGAGAPPIAALDQDLRALLLPP
jgi:1-aminocyclopropane-1-carboxylate deaminase/D-cysteine desulfhydrase-like pyridoxal-dependent ACC family enzyme